MAMVYWMICNLICFETWVYWIIMSIYESLNLFKIILLKFFLKFLKLAEPGLLDHELTC